MRTVKLTEESTKDIRENLLKRSPNNYGKFEESTQLCYAMKANPFLTGPMMDVVPTFELSLIHIYTIEHKIKF